MKTGQTVSLGTHSTERETNSCHRLPPLQPQHGGDADEFPGDQPPCLSQREDEECWGGGPQAPGGVGCGVDRRQQVYAVSEGRLEAGADGRRERLGG